MNIETKFKVGDTVYTIDPETLKVKAIVIGTISTMTTDKGTTVLFYPKDNGYLDNVNEDKCFASREALLDHITKG